jgi:hypothetical protein
MIGDVSPGAGMDDRMFAMSDREPLSSDDAEQMLDGLPLVPAMAGKLDEMKRIREQCLAAGIPVLVGCPPGAGKG